MPFKRNKNRKRVVREKDNSLCLKFVLPVKEVRNHKKCRHACFTYPKEKLVVCEHLRIEGSEWIKIKIAGGVG